MSQTTLARGAYDGPMRIAVVAALTCSLLSSFDARACPAPPPMIEQLTLVSDAGTVLPADGALLVERSEVPMRGGRDEGWALRGPDGQPVAYDVEPLGRGLERWRVRAAGERDLTISVGGTVLHTIHQTRVGKAKLAAPRVRAVTSTANRSTPTSPMAVLGATVTITLGRPGPARARYLAIALATAEPLPLVVLPVTAGQKDFEIVSYTRKSCSQGDPTIFAGDRLLLTWIDGQGRRSAASRVTVARARVPAAMAADE
jgi:hypothetical protein